MAKIKSNTPYDLEGRFNNEKLTLVSVPVDLTKINCTPHDLAHEILRQLSVVLPQLSFTEELRFESKDGNICKFVFPYKNK